MLTDEKRALWRSLCGLAVQLCGGQEQFKREANILRRLTKQYGPGEVEKMLRGAIGLRWNSLRSLGSMEGSGRRMAIEAYWKAQKREKAPESLRSILRRLAQ